MANAKVWLGDDSEAGARTTDDDGFAEFQNPGCGHVVVHAGSDGFKTVEEQLEVAGEAPILTELTLAPQSVQENLEVRASTLGMETSSSETGELQPEVMKELPTVPTTVADTLARLPGLLRSADGEINISGTGEQHGAFVVNQVDVTDPATGKFGPTLPIDVVEAINVEKAPFQAEYGRFTSGVVSVETHRGGDKWHAELNDPFPDFRIRSGHIDGLRNSTPRLLLGGPAIHDRLYLITELQYYLDKHPNLTLPYPFNESKQELVNSFTQIDYILSARHLLMASFHLRPQHVNYVNPEYFNPQPVTPSYAEHGYEWTILDRLAVGNGTLVSSGFVPELHIVGGRARQREHGADADGERRQLFRAAISGSAAWRMDGNVGARTARLAGKTRPEDGRVGGSSGEPRRVHGQSDRYRGPRAGAIEAHRVHRRKRLRASRHRIGWVRGGSLDSAKRLGAGRWDSPGAAGRRREFSHGAAGGNYLGAIQIGPNDISRGLWAVLRPRSSGRIRVQPFSAADGDRFRSGRQRRGRELVCQRSGNGRRAVLTVGA